AQSLSRSHLRTTGDIDVSLLNAIDIEELEALRLQIPANHLGRLADQSFRLLYLVKGHQAQRLDGLVDNEGVAPLVVFESDFHQAAQLGASPCVLAIAANKAPKGLEANDNHQPVPRRFFGDERPLAYPGSTVGSTR